MDRLKIFFYIGAIGFIFNALVGSYSSCSFPLKTSEEEKATVTRNTNALPIHHYFSRVKTTGKSRGAESGVNNPSLTPIKSSLTSSSSAIYNADYDVGRAKESHISFHPPSPPHLISNSPHTGRTSPKRPNEKEDKPNKLESPTKKVKSETDANPVISMISDDSSDLQSSSSSSSSYQFKEEEAEIRLDESSVDKGVWRRSLAFRYQGKLYSNKWHYEAGEELYRIRQSLTLTDNIETKKNHKGKEKQITEEIEDKVKVKQAKAEANIALAQIILFYEGASKPVKFELPYLFTSSQVKSISSKYNQITCGQVLKGDEEDLTDLFLSGGKSNDPKQYYHAERAYLLTLLSSLEQAIAANEARENSIHMIVFNLSSYYDLCPKCSEEFCHSSAINSLLRHRIMVYLSSNNVKLVDDYHFFFAISSCKKYGGSRSYLDTKDNCEPSNPILLPDFLPCFAQMRLEISSKELEGSIQIPDYVKKRRSLTLSQETLRSKEFGEDVDDVEKDFTLIVEGGEEAKNKVRKINPVLLEIATLNKDNDQEIKNYRLSIFKDLYYRMILPEDGLERSGPTHIIHTLLGMLPIIGAKDYKTLVNYYVSQASLGNGFLPENIFSNLETINKQKRDDLLAKYLSTTGYKGNQSITDIIDLIKIFNILYLGENVPPRIVIPERMKDLQKQKKKNPPSMKPEDDNPKSIPKILSRIQENYRNTELASIASILEERIGKGIAANKTFYIKENKYYFKE